MNDAKQPEICRELPLDPFAQNCRKPSLANAFNRIRPFRALVLGDLMLDTYTTGRVKRISPEAPVQVLEVLKQESRPGGAGNAVLNLVALGGVVIAMGRIGSDTEG